MKSMYIIADAATAIRSRKPSITPKNIPTTRKTKKTTVAAAGMTTITKATPTIMAANAGMIMATKATPMIMADAAVAAARKFRKSIMTT